jgi:hypothetical protein
MFSLDVFGNDYTFWETILGLFIHNIPSIILTIFLIISWKYELFGAISFFSAGILYISMLVINIIMNPPFQWYYLSWSLIMAGPALIMGVLFFISWKKNKKFKKKSNKK